MHPAWVPNLDVHLRFPSKHQPGNGLCWFERIPFMPLKFLSRPVWGANQSPSFPTHAFDKTPVAGVRPRLG